MTGDEPTPGVDVVVRACQVAAVAAVMVFPGVLAGGFAALAFGAADPTDWFATGAAVGAVLGVLIETDLVPGLEHSCDPSPPDGS